ncbi:MAG: hypothetical protein IPK79_04330 [Vampirovibrionales bacterium]|nr:hypothetical protein [Vampirovibrionales bacterium]
MASVFHQLKLSAGILRRKGLLLNMLAMFLLLMPLLIQPTIKGLFIFSGEALAWRLALAAIVYWLLFSAFSAGWFNMIAAAVRQELAPKATAHKAFASAASPALPGPPEPTRVAQTRELLRAFLPGVGEYFMPFAMGWLIAFIALGAILAGIHAHLTASGAYPVALLEDMARFSRDLPAAQQDPKALERFLMSQPVGQLSRLGQVMLEYMGGMAVFYLFWWMTGFWAPLVILAKRSLPKAYLESVGLFLRRAPGLIAVALLLTALGLAALFVGQFHMILEIIALFLLVALKATGLVFMFVHAYQALADQDAQRPPGERTILASAVNSTP